MTPPRTILFVDHTATLGGGEIALLNLIRAMDRTRFTPIVLLWCDGPLVDRLRDLDVETHIVPISRRLIETRKDSLGYRSLLRIPDALAAVSRIARFIVRRRVHLIHANSLKADVIAGLAGRLTGRPVIWHVRDRIAEDYLPAPAVRAFRRLARVIPHCVIANSRATLRTLQLNGNPPGRAIPSGIDAAVVHDGLDSPPAAGEAAASNGHPCVGIVGRIARWKGQHVFLHAAAKIRARFPAARFRIIGAPLFGEEEYERELHRLAVDLNLADRLEFTGFLHDVPGALAELDVFVHASITGEPFGQVIVEAMAAGLPIVATDGGAVREIVRHDRTGLLVPMEDADATATAVCRLLADPEGARNMGRRAQRHVLENFTIERAARQIERLYARLLRFPERDAFPRGLAAAVAAHTIGES